jgi:hypothetical protein
MNRNRDREVKEDGTGTGTTGTENVLMITTEPFQSSLLLFDEIINMNNLKYGI